MPRILKLQRAVTGKSFAIVASVFNDDIVKRLIEGAIGVLSKAGVKDDDIVVAYVPGAFELPLAAQALARTGKYAAVITVGAVIQGETQHHTYVAAEAARGIAQASLSTGVPVTFGVITATTRQQAEERSGPEVNRGAEAAEAALEMAGLMPRIS
jgi:6,7-dimethyl-8-ribityllumazine synthase